MSVPLGWFVLMATLGLCAAFGANDTLKPFGCAVALGALSRRRALFLASVCRVIAFAWVFLVAGSPLLPLYAGRSAGASAAIALGAAAAVALGSLLRQPVSVSHALLGALVGVAGAATPDVVRISVTLLTSPVLALAVAWALVPGLEGILAKLPRGAAALVPVLGCALSIAQSVQNLPKLLGPLLAQAPPPGGTIWAVGIGLVPLLVTGALLSWPVAQTLGERLVRLGTETAPHACTTVLLTAAGLEALANVLGAPVSSTHLLTGATLGVGLRLGCPDWAALRYVGLAWVLTAPSAALVAALFR